MKYLLLFLSLFFTIAVNANDDLFNTGKKIYEQTCVSCHGVDGKANVSMKLIVKPRDLTKTLLNEKQTYLIIKHGARYLGAKSDIMPAFKYVYNESQLKAVSYYISKEFNSNLKARIKKVEVSSKMIFNNSQNKMLKRGKQIFKRNCSWCHGITGQGDGIATKNPIDSIFPYNLTKTLLTQKQIFLYAKYGGKFWGTNKKDMPSWKRKYDDFTLKSVAKYVDEVIRGYKKF
jgi:mono/diheme cytochrome c family protein